MSIKVHLYVAENPLRCSGDQAKAICGAPIANPRPVFMVDLEHMGSYGFPVGTCRKCRQLEADKKGRYHYGIANGEEMRQEKRLAESLEV